MKFACEYCNEFVDIGSFDELVVLLSPNHDIDYIEEFFKNHPQHTVTIAVTDVLHFVSNHWLGKFLTLIPPEKYNWKLKLCDSPFSDHTKELVEECHRVGVPFFYSMFVDSWEVLYALVSCNPSDMYICNSLAFDIIRVSEVLHKHNIEVRVFPNVSQSSVPGDNDITSFFIRPEDTQLYKDYVDTFEIWASYAQDNLKLLYYLMYSMNIKWKGALDDFIIGLDLGEQSAPNMSMVGGFGAFRIKCKRECKQYENCRICPLLLRSAKVLAKNNIALVYKNEQPQKLDKKAKLLPQQFKDKIKQNILNYIDIQNMPQEVQDTILEKIKKI